MPALTELCRASGARTAVDLFTGTTRVAQAFKGEGVSVTAVDSSRTAHVLAQTYVATDAGDPAVSPAALADAVQWLNGLPGEPGYVTETFCVSSRYFQPENGARIDAVRSAIEAQFAGSPLWPVLITSLLEAADRVDSTTGLQMAYLKQWADRSHRPLELRVPDLLAGPGVATRGDALSLVAGGQLDAYDLAYLDPPYNQHRYDANYHVWETVIESGRRRCTTAWHASGWTSGTPRAGARSTAGAPCPRPWPGLSGRSTPRWSSCPTTTSPGSPWPSCTTCAGPGATSRCWPSTPPATSGARIGIHDPKGRKVDGVRGSATPSTSWWPGSGLGPGHGRGGGRSRPGRAGRAELGRRSGVSRAVIRHRSIVAQA